MEIKINYNECLTNVICSIEKYFGVDYAHSTLDTLDEVLERKQPENVVLILYDGMGDNTMCRNMDPASFFMKNRRRSITSVFPPTTTAATTTVQNGLNPSEHCWLGWTNYIPKIDKVVAMFMEREKETSNINEQFIALENTEYGYKNVWDKINEKGIDQGYYVSPFGEDGYKGLDEMLERTLKLCQQKGRKYIYAYNNEPDHTMHEYGPDSKEALVLMNERDTKTKALCDQLENSVVIVVADHGHVLCENVFFENYDCFKMLKRTTSIEPRACSIEVKEEYKEQFKDAFNKELGEYFELLSKEEVLEMKLFGDGNEHPAFKDSVGDYLAVAVNTNKCLMTEYDYPLNSQHAGLSDDEVYIPLIIVEK